MSVLTERLAEALSVCDAATAGPWYVAPGMVPAEVFSGAGSGDDPSVTYEMKRPDAIFIAKARTGHPAALRALQAVLELHQPILGYNTQFFPDGVCAECIKDAETEGTIAWPCATVLAIIEHLGEQ